MGKDSKIAWTDHTWNPWVGCNKVSAGCENCYMFRDQKMFGNDPTEIRRTKKKTFQSPFRWKEPSRIFVCSWSDFFHPAIPEGWVHDALDVIFGNQHHTFLFLTKRPENIRNVISDEEWYQYPNIWLGVTAENQEMADKRIPLLLDVPAKIKFISAEPLLGKINLWGNESGLVGSRDWNGKQTFIEGLDWVIAGGESGHNCREMKYEWAEFLKNQCKNANVPFFMKQMTGNTKEKRENIPEDLMIREFPNGNNQNPS